LRAPQERRDARYAEAARLREQGLSIRAVAKALGVERKTVRCGLRAGQAPTWHHAARSTSILDPHRNDLKERWAGCRNAATLWRELKERGFPGQDSVVWDWKPAPPDGTRRPHRGAPPRRWSRPSGPDRRGRGGQPRP